jgi:hypothetical protein
MLTIFIIVLFAFFKSIADTIKVPGMFDNSYFARYKGKAWIDPLVTKPEPKNFFIRPFFAMFRDLWHTCNTINITLIFVFAYFYARSELYLTFPVLVAVWWLVYGYCFEWFLNVWKLFK